MGDFQTTTVVRARKEHLCCECRTPIQVGGEYVRITGVYDGAAYRYRQCKECRSISDWLWPELQKMHRDPDEGISFCNLYGELVEYASESRFSDPVSIRHMADMAERIHAAKEQSE